MRFKPEMFLLLILLSLGSIGCSSLYKVELYPITTLDIISVKKGESLTAPKDGYFLSDEYMKEVNKAKVGK